MRPEIVVKPQIELEQSEMSDIKRDVSKEKPSDNDFMSTQHLETFETNDEAPNKVTFKFVMTLVAFSMAFVGSQLLGLLFATLTTLVSNDLNAGSKSNWLFSANVVATGATAPFVGIFSDLYGCKTTAIGGAAISLLGMIVCATSLTADGYIAGQVFGGMGSAIQQLMTVVAVSELVPIAERGLYVGMVISGFIPFAPGSLYGEWIAEHDWRYNAWLMAVWNFLTIIMLAIFYQPPPRTAARSQSKWGDIHRLDLLGGFLSITGVVLFLVGLNWGGQTYSWSSAQVISTLTLGLAFFVAFVMWEFWGAQYPLFPRRMIKAPRAFFCINVVGFAAGIGNVPVLIFWTAQATAVYGADNFHLGLYTLPFGCCVLGGAIISAMLLSALRKHVQWVMAGFCIMQTIGIGCMVAVDPHNIDTVWAPLILGLIGAGGVSVPCLVIITAITPDEFIATATALSVSVQAIGQVIALALFYNRLSNSTTEYTLSIMLPIANQIGISDFNLIESIVLGVTATPWSEIASTVPQINTAAKYNLFAEGLITLYAKSFPILYYISIAFGGVACIACFFTGDLGKFMNKHVAVQL